MASTLASIFGVGTTIDFTDPNEPVLKIPLKNLENTGNGGQISNNTGFNDISVITANTANAYSSAIFFGLISRLYLTQPQTNVDPTIGVYITYNSATNPGFTTRGNDRQLVYTYNVLVYGSTSVGNLDLDNVL